MNILLTSATGFPSPDTGGPNKIIYYLLKRIKSSGNGAGYISKHYQMGITQKFASNNINYINSVRSKLYSTFGIYRRLVTHPFYLQFHYKKLEDFFHSKLNLVRDYDCLNFHDIISGYYLRNTNKKKILSIHSKGSITNELKDTVKSKNRVGQSIIRKVNEMEKIAFDDASFITFPSLAAKKMFLNSSGLKDSAKIKIIYNGIDLEEIHTINKSKKIMEKYRIPNFEYCIFNVANHIKIKNIDRIILSLQLLVKKYKMNICLINSGSGLLTRELKKITHKLKLEDNIFFLGVIPNEDVLKLMKVCDYFVMTSDNVVFDMVILEALACETIVIANHQGGNKEIIKDGVNGYFIYKNEPEEIAQKIISADSNVINGAINTIKSYTVENMVQKYIELYFT